MRIGSFFTCLILQIDLLMIENLYCQAVYDLNCQLVSTLLGQRQLIRAYPAAHAGIRQKIHVLSVVTTAAEAYLCCLTV